MNAKRVGAAEVVLFRAMPTRRTAAGLAMALESAALLNDEDIAAELVELRKLPAEVEALRKDRDAFRDQRNAVFATNKELLARVDRVSLERIQAQNRSFALAREVDRLRARVAELEAAAGDGSTRTVDEDPIAYSLTEQVADQDQEAGQDGPPCQRCGAPAVSHVAWASGHLYVAPSTPSAVEALHASSGAVIEIPARQRVAVEEPHDDPVGLHHDYRVPHDLPPAVTS
jgi:septal ring factor EnvC (AmiA/AmiB activator)